MDLWKTPQPVFVEDRRRLNQNEFLKDTLIRFWLKWIQYGTSPAEEIAIRDNSIHVFDTQHYSQLLCKGAKQMTQTKYEKLPLFEKTMLIIPINVSNMHWFVAAIANPGLIGQTINRRNKDDPLPCIIFLDTYPELIDESQSDTIRTNLTKWMIAEMHARGMVSSNHEPVLDMHFVRVPHQDNGFDCALCACYYTYVLLKTKLKIRVGDVYNKKGKELDTSKQFKTFQDFISSTRYQPDLPQFRKHMLKLTSFIATRFRHVNAANNKNNSADVLPIK